MRKEVKSALNCGNTCCNYFQKFFTLFVIEKVEKEEKRTKLGLWR
jgi:hypothetical protein